MALIHMTKGAPKLSKKVAEYLDKEKKEYNEASIKLNVMKSQIRKDPSNQELIHRFHQQKQNVRDAYDAWHKKSGTDITISGPIRIEMQKEKYKEKSKDEQIKLLVQKWNEQLNYVDQKKTHVGLRRFIFSPDPKQLDGLSQDTQRQLIHDSVQDTMRKFKDAFTKKGERISYAFSTHFDTNTPHAHVYLFPYTSKGQYLSMNASRYRRRSREKRRNPANRSVDKLSRLKVMFENSFEKVIGKGKKLSTINNKNMFKQISNPSF